MMTDEQKIARLQQALNEPEDPDFPHAQIRQKLQTLQTHKPGEGGQQYDVRSDRRTMDQGRTGLREFNDRVTGVGRGLKALGSTVIHPIDTFSSPEKTRQLVRGADDVFTLGYGRKLADEAHARLPSWVPGQGMATGRRPFAEVEEHDTLVAPYFRTAGSLPAMFAPNPANVLFRGAGAVVNKGFSKVPTGSAMTGGPMGAVESLVSYEATAPFAAAAHADNAGRRMEAAKEAAMDPLGIMLSTTLGGAGGGGRGHAARIRNPNTQSGRTIQDVEAAGGRIKKFGTDPVEGGLYETPSLKGLPEGRLGTHTLADKSVTRLEGANKQRLTAARQQFGDAVDDVIAQHGGKPQQTPLALKAVDDMQIENIRDNGTIRDAGVHKGLESVRTMLMSGGKPQITARDLVNARKDLRRMSNEAATPSENRVYQVVLSALDEDAVAIDPRIKQMNANFRKALEPIEGANEFLFNARDARLEPSPAQRDSAVGRLGRIGDDTQAGTRRDPALQRFEQLGPEYGQEALLMRAKKAQERLRRGEPQTSDAIDKTLNRGPSYFGRKLGGVFGGPIGFMAGLALDKYRQNPLANKIRLGLPAAETVGKLSGRTAVGVDQITGIARERGKKKRKNKEERPSP